VSSQARLIGDDEKVLLPLKVGISCSFHVTCFRTEFLETINVFNPQKKTDKTQNNFIIGLANNPYIK
jgi:hypothetical protein